MSPDRELLQRRFDPGVERIENPERGAAPLVLWHRESDGFEVCFHLPHHRREVTIRRLQNRRRGVESGLDVFKGDVPPSVGVDRVER